MGMAYLKKDEELRLLVPDKSGCKQDGGQSDVMTS